MTKIRSPIKWLLFGSSYSPLFVILAFKLMGVKFETFGIKMPLLSIILGILTFLSIIILIAVLRIFKGREPTILKPSDYSRQNDMITEYLLVYIYPFIVFNYESLWNWVSFLILFLVIGLLHVKSNYLFINPSLAFFGYDVIEVNGEGLHSKIILAKNINKINSRQIRAVKISSDVYLEVDYNGD